MDLFQLPAPVLVLIASLVFFAGIGAIAVHTSAGDQLAKSVSRRDSHRARSDDEELIRASEREEREMRESAARIDRENQDNSPDLEREQLQSTWGS